MINKKNDFAARGDVVLSPVLGHFSRINIASGNGSILVAVDGTEYIDFAAGIAVSATGHAHPTVVKAISDQAGKLIHGCAGVVYYEPNISLAEKLGTLLGHDLSQVFFTQSGTEAVEAALKLAKHVSGKHGMLAFNGGFHGRTMGALSVTSKEKYRAGIGPMLEGVHFLPYNDISGLDEFFKENGSRLAGVIVEPTQGEGGYIPATSAFLKTLSRLCKQYGVYLILDEIQTGFGRTGKWFNFQHYIDVTPDIVVLAKGMASGMPLGACVSRPDLMEKWTTGAHGGTYSGNPVCCAAANATIAVIESQLDTVLKKAAFIHKTLQSKIGAHPGVKTIRGIGLMQAVEFEDMTIVPDIVKRCHARGLIVVNCGSDGQVIRLMPALTISKDLLKQGLSILCEVINEHYSR